MNERALSLLEQYDIEVLRTRKGRGTFICETKQGDLVFQEYKGNPEKLKLQQMVLDRIKTLGLVQAEELICDRENALFVKDSDEICYILKNYVDGNECDIYDTRECTEAMQLLARLHHCMEDIDLEGQVLSSYSPLKEYEKHNRELLRVWGYLKKKGQKQVFEKSLLHAMDYFVPQAKQVTEEWKEIEEERADVLGNSTWTSGICHGDYQYHNILRNAGGWHIVNFEKIQGDDPVRDVYLFIRKVMEKCNWDIEKGRELLRAYEAIRSLSAYSRLDLYYRFAYPEKFWKIANFYFNAPKAWIPEKNLEKLNLVIEQEEAKNSFLQEVFEKL